MAMELCAAVPASRTIWRSTRSILYCSHRSRLPLPPIDRRLSGSQHEQPARESLATHSENLVRLPLSPCPDASTDLAKEYARPG
jgi:hypothetical protein